MDKIDIYVLSEDLQMIGIVDAYKSLIWAPRYRDLGDCELYLKATTEALDLLQIGRYLVREDDDLVCRIKKIDLTTNPEEGNYLTITGTDAKSYLDQRIIWGTETVNGSVEAFVRDQVDKTLINPANAARALTKPGGGNVLALGTAAGLTETATEQISYKNLGEKVREYCTAYGWGYKVTWAPGGLTFSLHKGTDRTASVVFSPEYENLAATAYTEDHTTEGNVALVAGTGEGEARSRATVGFASGTERHEIFVDADDISDEISYESLKAVYPLSGASIVQSGDDYFYRLATMDIELTDQNLKAWLIAEYPTGSVITVAGVEYFRITNIDVAQLPDAAPADDDTVKVLPIIYAGYLTARGKERLSELGALTSFEGSVIPNVTFTYKSDYFLGDLVTVRNEYGIQKTARIVEVVEVYDDNGYSIEPAFEYLESGAEEAPAPSGQTIGYAQGIQTMTDQRIDHISGGGPNVIVTQNTQTGDLTIVDA